MQKPLEQVMTALANARQETDGSITADCPICANEDRHERIKLYRDASGRITGASCGRYARAGGGEANREHCKPALDDLGIVMDASAFIHESLFDGKLTLDIEPAERGKVRIVANNCESVLARDVIALDRADHRAAFIKSLPSFDDSQRETIHKTLLNLATRYDSVQAAIDREEETAGAVEKVVSKILPDGRVIEQIAGGQFAVYDPKRGEVTYARKIETDDAVYQPLDDDFVLKGGLFLPDRLIEYGDDKTLDAEIEACISRYTDAPDRELRLSAKYSRLSYIADRLNEISYLRATGERGSGKSRFIGTVGMLCLRPVLVSSPSAASLYRMLDGYQPTLIIDECNFEQGSEDATALMQVLNCGFQRLTFIPRIDRGGDGQLTLRMFSAFGPKLIGSLKLSDSPAFESRCVPVQLRKTTRKDIPFRLTDRMIRDFAELRAKLYLWRLRNLTRDYEQALDDAERDLKKFEIEPRFIQIAIPLYGMLAEDAGLKKSFAEMLEGRTDDAANEKQLSFEGMITGIVHRLLFEVDDDNRATWKPLGNYLEPEEGKPLESATVEQITEKINEGLSDKKKYTTVWIGRELGKLGFKRKEINRRASGYWKKPAVVFDRSIFARVFGNFLLPLPPDFTPVTPVTAKNVNDDGSLTRPEYFQNEEQGEAYSGRVKPNEENDLGRVTGVTGVKMPETGGEEFQEAYSGQISAVPSVVALDTETEPFDEKRGITPRTAKMIGLAICYDGDRADYITDREAWPLMMPESEQAVIFHNAKFDLLKLRQAGLPLPEKWEDTMIAAHVVDENGAHGLKDLAKDQLGIEDPVTFDEADRMRLLDPDIFTEYARNDSRYTFRLWPRLEREIDRQGLRQVYELEKAVVPAVLAMEEAGLKLDLSQMATMHEETKAECARIKAEVFDHAGCEFDLNSPKKVAAIVYEKLGLPCSKETGTGAASVDREALEDIRGYHPAIDAILRFREVDKLAGTFLKTLPTFADSAGRIHPEFKPLGAKTGRFSCSNPNVQQIPARSELGKKLRRMFIADEGKVLVVADWSQMELRVLAQYSQDPLLIEAYTGATETDLHTLTAARMFGKTEADVTKPERSIAKMINFGIAYGITPIGLFNRLKPSGVDVTEEQCKQFVDDYFRTYPGVRKFLSQVEARLKERGYVRNWFARRRRVSGATAREVRQAQNFIIQATAADIAKTAMVNLHRALPDGARLIAMVHDEFIVECRTEQAEEVRAMMIGTMQTAPDGFKIPMLVEAKIADTWGDAK